MHNVLLVARREYLEQIRGRAFRLTTIMVPAVFVLLIAIAYFSSIGLGSHRHLVIASNDANLANAIRTELLTPKSSKRSSESKPPQIDVLAPATETDRLVLQKQVQSKSIDGFLFIQTSSSAAPIATYTSASAADLTTNGRLNDAVDHAVVDQRLAGFGLSGSETSALDKGVKIETYQIRRDGGVVKSNALASFYKGYAMAILLSMTTVMYGLNVARSIIQEKTSRIFEVMLSIVKPSEMLAGKLVGVGAVGLTQILIWVVAAALILTSSLATAYLKGDFEIHFSWVEAIMFPVYFILGYFLYSSLFSGIAATCETEQELQMYTPLAALPVWLSFSVILVIINDPNSFWSVALSLFPPCAPIVMFLRMGSEIPPAWQFAASIILMVISIWAILWVSARLYRIGILMYGKRATLPEILRWLRYS
ncbi:ABC transporter permease [Acidicapsa dinghuensis]|uniref:ABC transporter permease n=1 Tax=Acidicapsa dinghuensis TaxID=2218256 RepID=A0ABW1EIH6_9BACT|nr:ABC transporter permease [Acidicapsa dinghuensis]